MAGKGLWLRSIALGAVVLMATGAGHAFDGNDVLKLKTTKRCRSCDLYAADLSGADLSGADLIGANLSGANLSGANLSARTCSMQTSQVPTSRAQTSRAPSSSDAKLAGANLNSARLAAAIWTDGRTCEPDSVRRVQIEHLQWTTVGPRAGLCCSCDSIPL